MRVLVCGTGYGSSYLTALWNHPAGLRLAGILARGSGRSQALARQWGVSGAIARDVLIAAEGGDARAVAIREGLYFWVASSIRALVLTLDVETIVLGGGLSAYGSALTEGTCKVLDDWAARSDFLASLDMAARIELLDPEVPVAALGAAELGEGAVSHG